MPIRPLGRLILILHSNESCSLYEKKQAMWLLLIIFSIIGIVLLCWAVVKGNCVVRLLTVFAALALSCYLGYGIGRGWERMSCYDTYIYWFSEYSTHLHDLVKEQKTNELTNTVVLFDTKWNSHKDAQTLQSVMYEILKVGPYSKTGTNAVPSSRK